MKLPFLSNVAQGTGSIDKATGQIRSTPFEWEFPGGIFVSPGGSNGCSAWMYREIPTETLKSVDSGEQEYRLSKLMKLFEELAQDTSKGDQRSIHLVSHDYEADFTPVSGTTEDLSGFLQEVIEGTRRHRSLFLGVQLRRNPKAGTVSNTTTLRSLFDDVFNRAEEITANGSTGLIEEFGTDIEHVDAVLCRHTPDGPSWRDTTDVAWRHLKQWYSHQAETADTLLEYGGTDVISGTGSKEKAFQMSAVTGFGAGRYLEVPHGQFLAAARSTDDAPVVISVRAELLPTKEAKKRMYKTSRRNRERLTAESRVVRHRTSEKDVADLSLLDEILAQFDHKARPIFDSLSIVMASEVREGQERRQGFRDVLRDHLGVDTCDLNMRQHTALMETLPCSSSRVGKYNFASNMELIAYSGIQGVSTVGDPGGNYIGLTEDLHPVFLDPHAVNREDRPATTLIVGTSGSGKTFLAQSLVYQSLLADQTVVFFDPKEGSDLKGLKALAESHGKDVHIINLGDPGSVGVDKRALFDPMMTYADRPTVAKERVTEWLNAAMFEGTDAPRPGTTQAYYAVRAGIADAIDNRVKTLTEAVRYIGTYDQELLDAIDAHRRHTPVFDLFFAPENAVPPTFTNGSLVLIEFGSGSRLPPASKPLDRYSNIDVIRTNAMAAVVDASKYILGSSGGVLAIDEAWALMQTDSGRAAIEDISRLGRSQNISMFLFSQLMSHLTKSAAGQENGIRSLVSRFIILNLEHDEGIAALEALGLKELDAHMQTLKDAKASGGRPPRFLFKDQNDRLAWVHSMANIPGKYIKLFKTDPEHKVTDTDSILGIAPKPATDEYVAEVRDVDYGPVVEVFETPVENEEAPAGPEAETVAPVPQAAPVTPAADVELSNSEIAQLMEAFDADDGGLW